MSVVFVLIPVLAGLWVLQSIGTYFQMSHYRKVLSEITANGTEGYVGVGNAKGRLGKGVILILVSGPDGKVVRSLRMRGMTVFARFEEAPELVGLRTEHLAQIDLDEPYDASTMLAARRAVEQIDRIRESSRETDEPSGAEGGKRKEVSKSSRKRSRRVRSTVGTR
ncbi:Glucitol operon activator protein (GutM) [Rubrobacter radiotolerans]|uniref:Glucitol operon activator protein (GutM) n=1 Tax=Rubrobacter radiotolerans TaxID=42256 RepID=A0A023X4E1_RUBRA|nr:Glucitol operon activator protein (GutM) [Rubrobacter radiotolerans]SMC05744.1 glucitol operon activator protein [Rubrobacter radiotolerans DSM 5868]